MDAGCNSELTRKGSVKLGKSVLRKYAGAIDISFLDKSDYDESLRRWKAHMEHSS